ncbi:uncharacterized protein [Labrus bergylta]|uniref:uncharacterized protein n=1 Tax=Labrus bergylta TaxID=56723 RepID=UPI0033142E1D
MSVCTNCEHHYSQLKDDIQRLKSELRNKDHLIEGFVSVAAAQSKHISYMQSSSLAVRSPSAPPSPASKLVSASAATLPWLTSDHLGLARAYPEEPVAETTGPRSMGDLSTGASGTDGVGTEGLASALTALDQDATTPAPSGNSEGAPGKRLLAPVHSSTPKPPELPWTDVVHRRRKTDHLAPPQPRMTLHNRFTLLKDGAPVGLGLEEASAAAARTPAPNGTTRHSARAPHGLATSPPPAARSSGREARHSATGKNRRKMLQEAVTRRSGGLPPAEPRWRSASLQSPQHDPPALPQVVTAERPQADPDSTHSPPPCPLFPPTTLIIGDSITRNVRFFNATTPCLPGATVPSEHTPTSNPLSPVSPQNNLLTASPSPTPHTWCHSFSPSSLSSNNCHTLSTVTDHSTEFTIPVHVTCRLSHQHLSPVNYCNHSNLTQVRLQPLPQPTFNCTSANFGLLNIRSLNNKSFICLDFINHNNLDFFIVTETWLTMGDCSPLIEATPPDFTHLHQPRMSGRGGGVAVIHRKDFKCSPISHTHFTSFEHLGFIVNLKDPVLILIIYRPPRPNNVFIAEFSEFLSHFISKYDKILVLGDFNIHVCCPSQSLAGDFMDILESFNLTQAIQEPTHSKGHTLDLVLYSGLCPNNFETKDICVSDHKLVLFRMVLSQPPFISKAPVRSRVFNSTSASKFKELFISVSSTAFYQHFNTEELVSSFNLTCQAVLDSVAPYKDKKPNRNFI